MPVEAVCAVGVLVPFAGTALGASLALLSKGQLNPTLQKLLLGFASGVMLAASVWSLLIPALEMAADADGIAWLPAAAGFLAGMGFLLLLDSTIPHLHIDSDKPEGLPSRFGSVPLLAFAVTLHNIPEGMAVGVTFAGVLSGEAAMTLAGALALSLGIALQNFPEGAIVSLPLRSKGASRGKAFGVGLLSGIVEPIAAVATMLLAASLATALPFLLSFAAGAMIYVVVEELIPETQTGPGGHSNAGVIGCALGFVLMMVLDTAL